MAARREVGIRTVFNLLGPLTNPAGANAQVIGVAAAALTEPLARVLAELGTLRAFVVHGADGLDEISNTGESRVSEVREGVVRTFTVRPEDFGLSRASIRDLLGGDREQNAEIIRDDPPRRARPQARHRPHERRRRAGGRNPGARPEGRRRAGGAARSTAAPPAKLERLVGLTRELSAGSKRRLRRRPSGRPIVRRRRSTARREDGTIGTSRALGPKCLSALAFLFRVSALSRLLSAFESSRTPRFYERRQDEAEQSSAPLSPHRRDPARTNPRRRACRRAHGSTISASSRRASA